MNIEKATKQLEGFIPTYQSLEEREKFALARMFNENTGGKLSPFNSPSPVCVGLIPVLREGQVGFLGVRRAIPPCVGEVALPGGFLSPNEDPVAGMVREVFEETGLSIDPDSVPPNALVKMGHNNNMLMFFTSKHYLPYSAFQAASAALASTDGEASELVFITPETPLCFPLHQEAVNSAFENLGQYSVISPAKSFKP